jgi:hypothetical protein
MGIRRGSISTPIIADGLVCNFDAANRASYPVQRTLTIAESGSCYNTLDLTQSGSFISDPQFITQPASASCWNFDGVDDYISLDQEFDATNGLTWSSWIKYDGVGAGLNWLCSNGGTGGVKSQFNTRMIADGRWFNYYHGSATYTDITGLNDGNWHNIVQTLNYSNGDVKFYKDAVVGPTVLTFGSGYTTAIVKQISTSFYPFKGDIASVQFYTLTLSANEVLHNYNALKGRFS